MGKWSRHLYQPCLPLGKNGSRITASSEHIELSRKAACEGMILLKNDNNVLPLAKGSRLVLFGKGTIDYVRGGGGSGEVNVPYYRNIYEGLKLKENEGKLSIFDKLVDYYKTYVYGEYAKGSAPGMIEEIAVPKELVEEAANYSDTAVITISRFSGEGWDRISSTEPNEALWEQERIFTELQARMFPNSDFCLTNKELALVNLVKEKFNKIIIVINSGGVIETAWIKNDTRISSALFAWQAGIEGGLAIADLLVGDETPSAKTVDTFANKLEDYPSTYNFHESKEYCEYTDDIYVGYRYFETIPGASSRVVYPFGYGLSYTTFDIKKKSLVIDGNFITLKVSVKNTGNYSGKEVVMAYYSAPGGVLGKAKYELAAFKKTRLLLPNDEEELELSFTIDSMASYDDVGKIAKSAWLLEKGTYSFYLGNNVEKLIKLEESFTLNENVIIEQLTEMLHCSNLKERLKSDGTMEAMPKAEEKKTHSILPHMANRDTEALAPYEPSREIWCLSDRKDIMLIDVAEGRNTLDEFMSQLSIQELIHLVGGQRNQGVSNTFGIGYLPEYGVPNVSTADGPAGLRILPQVGVTTTAWPCSTMLACSYNVDNAYLVGQAAAREVKENNIGIWLAPGVNIHRTPICGRNFEYYSEDPVVAGTIGSSVVSGIQSQNIASTVKHFAFNNKETNRKNSDSRVSERAAREIYLKVFEIIVKNAKPWCIMTSYNKVNSIHSSENEELINGILRGEWGYQGVVMTDWWTSSEEYLEVKAGNDLKMGNGFPKRLKEAYDAKEITYDEIYIAAKNVLSLILKME